MTEHPASCGMSRLAGSGERPQRKSCCLSAIQKKEKKRKVWCLQRLQKLFWSSSMLHNGDGLCYRVTYIRLSRQGVWGPPDGEQVQTSAQSRPSGNPANARWISMRLHTQRRHRLRVLIYLRASFTFITLLLACGATSSVRFTASRCVFELQYYC